MEKVKELMTEDPIVAEVPGNRKDAIDLMVKNEITGMPVVKDGKLRGFVSRHDFFNNPEEEQLALIYRKDYPSVCKEDSLEKAAELLVENDLHYLPVSENGDECVGIITTADMLRFIEERGVKTPIGDVARSPCVPMYEDTPINVVLKTMKLTGIFAFPVVDDDADLSGIITDRDLFNLSEIKNDIEVSELGVEQDEDRWSWKGLKNVMKLYHEESKFELPSIAVKEAMVEDPRVVYSETEVQEAAKIMRRNDYGQLPIVDENDSLESMVYELDLLTTVL